MLLIHRLLWLCVTALSRPPLITPSPNSLPPSPTSSHTPPLSSASPYSHLPPRSQRPKSRLPQRPAQPVLVTPGESAASTYVIAGDVMLGVMISVSDMDESKPCGDRLRETGVVQLVEAVVYALNKVNARSEMLSDELGMSRENFAAEFGSSRERRDARQGGEIFDRHDRQYDRGVLSHDDRRRSSLGQSHDGAHNQRHSSARGDKSASHQPKFDNSDAAVRNSQSPGSLPGTQNDFKGSTHRGGSPRGDGGSTGGRREEAFTPVLPPGVRLGAVIVDDCNKQATSLARALHFLPVRNSVPDPLDELPCSEEDSVDSADGIRDNSLSADEEHAFRGEAYVGGVSTMRVRKSVSERGNGSLGKLHRVRRGGGRNRALGKREGSVADRDDDLIKIFDKTLGQGFKVHVFGYDSHNTFNQGGRDAIYLKQFEKAMTRNDRKSDFESGKNSRLSKRSLLTATTNFFNKSFSNHSNDTTRSSRQPPNHPPPAGRAKRDDSSVGDSGGDIFHDVVGVIGPEGSSASVVVANLLGMFHVPQISPTASTDDLSDKTKYPYFLRMAPPDRHQVEAMVHLIDHFNWTYIAAVYSKGSYGESAIEKLRLMAPQFDICVGPTLAIAQNPVPKQLKDIVDTLVGSKARVVVLFTDQEETRALFGAIRDMQQIGYFVWLGSDAVGLNLDDLDDLEHAAVGALTLNAFSHDVPAFQEYFKSLSPQGNSANPWFARMWAAMFNCSWGGNSSLPHNSTFTSMTPCQANATIADAQKAKALPRAYSPESIASLYMDAVNVYAHAIGRLLSKHCPLASGAAARACITGPLLLAQLRDTDLAGYIGNITFDANGDIFGKYEITNFQCGVDGIYCAQRVAVWYTNLQRLDINDSRIVWRVKDVTGGEVPKSECGVRCLTGEVHSYFKDTCCWECRPCALNEITTLNATRCAPCPELTWPNQRDLGVCEPLAPAPRDWGDPVVILLVILPFIGVLYCTAVLAIYIRHNSARLIKATSRELSYMMLAGVFTQYCLVYAVIATPTTLGCHVTYVGFNVSFTLVYAPLLTRTNRIYRIFKCGRRSKALPSLTSPLSQVVIALALVAVQVVINAVVCVTSAPRAELRQPDAFKPYVERACAVSVQGFVTSLAYSVLLVVVCTWYAFRTRALPDNFNESRCISLCVYTTLVIWLVFVPSYFTTGLVFHQLILISSALLLNATVTLLCLYSPKVYAIYQGLPASAPPTTLLGGAAAGGAGAGANPGLRPSFETIEC